MQSYMSVCSIHTENRSICIHNTTINLFNKVCFILYLQSVTKTKQNSRPRLPNSYIKSNYCSTKPRCERLNLIEELIWKITPQMKKNKPLNRSISIKYRTLLTSCLGRLLDLAPIDSFHISNPLTVVLPFS